MYVCLGGGRGGGEYLGRLIGRQAGIIECWTIGLTNCLVGIISIYCHSNRSKYIVTPIGVNILSLWQVRIRIIYLVILFACLFNGVWCHFLQYLSYIVAVSSIGGRNRTTWRKPPTCHKSLTNFITSVVLGTDCIGSCKSIYHTIMVMTAHFT